MSRITDTAERIARMLADASDEIVSVHWYTQESIDQDDRPCWLVFPEDTSIEQDEGASGEENISTSFSLAFIGHPYNAGGYTDFTPEYEEIARQVADDTMEYFMAHKGLQVSNRRGLLPERLYNNLGVLGMEVTGRSAITLFEREGVNADSFWGFTMDISVKQMVVYEEAI